MSDVPQRTRGFTKDYSLETVQTALGVLVTVGSPTKASKVMEEAGTPVSPQMICHWRDKGHVDLYERLRTELAPKIEAQIIESTRAAITRSAEVEARLLERLDEVADELKPSDVANALRNTSTTKGINTQNYLTLTGRPNQIVEHRDVTEILKALADKAPGLVIDGTAEETTDNPNPEQD